tara:strand:+ start:124 stop:525 length:402 start_codon:yes stop_codon:yes gene_type:complete
MTLLIVTTISASILGALYIRLALNVIKYRRKYGVSVGDGGEEELLRAIRAHANLTEYAPIGLILIACLEMNAAPIFVTAPLALMFTIGRILHPLGMGAAGSALQPRVRGMQLTLFGVLALVIANLVLVVLNAF